MFKFGTKSALFWCFWARILKNYCHIWNQHLRICLIAKFCEETKMPKCGTKNALLRYFWPKMSYLDIFGQEFEKTIVVFEISTLKFAYLQNFPKKQKCLNLGPKMPDLGIFGLEFWKTIVIFEISTLNFVKKESLTHIVNFGIGSAFSKGPGSVFSEGPGPSLGPLYKVCLYLLSNRLKKRFVKSKDKKG